MKNISILNTLQGMSTKQKISYVWDYYKIHILSSLVILFLIISFTYSQLTSQETYFDITYIGASINVDELSHVDDSLNQIVLNGSSKKVINLDSIFTDNSSDNLNEQFSQKFMVKIAAKEIDMAIVSKKFFENNYSSDMFLNLNSLEGFSSLPIANHEVIKRNDSNGNLAAYGISVKNINLLSNVKFTSDDYILVIISNSEKIDRSLDMLKVFLKNK
jgi:hypothetical protein